MNGFVIARETKGDATRVLRKIQCKADKDAVETFADQVKKVGASTSNKTGTLSDSRFKDLVLYNGYFKTE